MLSLSRAAVSAAVTVSSKKSTSATTKIVQRTLARSIATKASSSKNNGNSNHGSSSSSSSSKFFGLEALMAVGLSVATATTGVTMLDAAAGLSSPHYPQPKQIQVDELTPATIPSKPRLNEPPPRPDLPTYSREEVSEHCDEDSLWYTFRGAVYDLTFFYKGHPGGSPVRIVVVSFSLSLSLSVSLLKPQKEVVGSRKAHVMHMCAFFSSISTHVFVCACVCFNSLLFSFHPSISDSLSLSLCAASVDGCRSRLGTVLGGNYSTILMLITVFFPQILCPDVLQIVHNRLF